MRGFDIFPFVWLGGVLVAILVNVSWAINDLRVGSARLSWYGSRVDREEEPFEFWLAVIGKLAVIPVGGFMFWMGLDMLKW